MNQNKSIKNADKNKARANLITRMIVVFSVVLTAIILILVAYGLSMKEFGGSFELNEYPLVMVDASGKVESKNNAISFESGKTTGGDIKVSKKEISENALFYTYTTKNGVNMQLIFVKAPNGKIRVGLNTSEDCRGEADSFFVQGEGVFTCTHCGAVISNAEVGLGTNSAAPVGINFTEKGGKVIIAEDDLLSFEDWFTNWEGPLG